MESNLATRAMKWSARSLFFCAIVGGCTSATNFSPDPPDDTASRAESLLTGCEGYKYCDCGLWVATNDTCPARSCDMCEEGFRYCGCWGGCLVNDLTCSPQPDECGDEEIHCQGALRDCGGGVKASPDSACPGGPLVGDGVIESNLDSNADGSAEAFQYVAATSGAVSVLTAYIDTTNTAPNVIIGLYSDDSGHPGTLLTQGTLQWVYQNSGWHSTDVPPVTIVANQPYWIALLAPHDGGLIKFRDRDDSAYTSETSAESELLALPATWTTGVVWSTSSASAYASR